MINATPAQLDPVRFFSLPFAGGKGGHSATGNIGAAAFATSLDGHFTVTTSEGDRVTLSANVVEDFRSLLYRGEGRFGEVLDVEAHERDYAVNRNIGVVVEGHLNEQEQNEIARLFETVGQVFRQFFTGQSEEGLAQAISLTDQFGASSSLSTLELNLHVQRSVTVATAGQSVIDSAAPSGADTPGEASQTPAAIPPASLGTTAPTQLFPFDREKLANTLAERLLKAVEASRLRRPTLRDFLAPLLERAEQEARGSSALDDERADIAQRAREKVLHRTNEPEEPGRVFVAVLAYSRSFVKEAQYDILA